VNRGKNTCLTIAIRANSTDMVGILLEAKADPALGSPSAETLIHERKETKPELHALLRTATAL
jgi:ankyrin repeat protein